jgi:elongation factor Ts
MVEVNAETDFVARNEQFQGFVAELAGLVLAFGDDVEKLKHAEYPGSKYSVQQKLNELIATIGENMTIRRAKRFEVANGAVASYVHNAIRPGLGKIGVLVALEGQSEIAALEQLGRQIGMHVAAARPDALDTSSVDPSALEREKTVLAEQARVSGKPDAIIAKMVEGRIRKYYEEVVLLEQVWVHDGESRVKEVVKKAGGDLTGFARFQLGEGIEKAASDFAAEVAATAGLGR